MQAQATSAAVCPECGTRLEGGFSRNLGRCMICLLRVGFEGAEEPDEAPLSSVADRLGNYCIERCDDGSLWELGRGAMGVTYRAVDTSLRRAVALKLIDSEWVKRGAEARERFMREARTAASLRHPNIATVYHFGIREENGQCFCAMELVEGETLEMRVRRTGPLDALTTIDIALQVSSALTAAEKQGLVHRDLKPANLMLVAAAADANDSSVGKAEKAETVVKVIDFGVAKALVEKPDPMGLTQGGFVGTPAFASPEQFTDAPVGVRSDIYSLGATLWYLLTGHRPFEGATIEQIRASQHSQALPIEQLKAARVPSRLVSLLVSMLAPEPAARPDVRALTSQLQDCRAQILNRWKAARRLALTAGLIGIAAAAFVLFLRWHNRAMSRNAAPANISEKSIAVLQFENRSPDKNDAYVASGVRNEIVTKLTQMRGLQVISRNLRTKSGGPPAELRELGRKLGATNFLGGSIQRTADSISIDLQLIEAPTGTRLWAQSYKRALAQASELEGEVAQSVADALKIKLAPAEAQRLRAAFTSNPRAHDLYLRAIALTPQADEKSHEQQIAMLREAVAEDPDYAEAWSALSQAYVHMGDAYRAPREILLPARDAAIKAVSLDDQLSDVHLVLGGIALTYDWNFPLAKREFERAIALDPNSAVAHRLYGWYLARAERNYVAARQEMATARRLDPLNTWPWWGESGVAIAQGDYEGALRLAERVMEINPEFLYDEDPIAHVYVAMGRWNDALQRYQSIPASRFNRPNFELAICYAHTGQVARSRVILVELEKLAQERYVDHTHLAAIHAALGDKDKAFAALDQALNDRSARVYAPRFYPWLAPLREDPRFVELENKIARSQLPQSAEVASRPFEKSIAVLPFDNLSDDQANAYFAVGIQDEILTSLARVADLKVISRTSVMQYKARGERNLRQIGRQLGVAHVLEGSVQRVGKRVRVNAQLIDARTDAHLWAQTYDRDLADVFAIQSEIAKAIADQLQARLSPNEKKAIEQPPTTDLAAFDLYSHAKSLLLTADISMTQEPDVRKAIELLDEAVKRDPSFFDAYCRLARAHEWFYAVTGSDHTPARLALAEAALQAATRLRPDAAETHLSRAEYLYYGLRDYAGALAELEIARRVLPNDPRLFELTGYILQGRGQQEEGLQNLQRAVELDPRNFSTLQQIAMSYEELWRYAEAIAALDRSSAILPDNVETRATRAEIELYWKADTRPLHQTIDAILAQRSSAIASAAGSWFDCALAERDPAAAERALVALGDNPCWGDSTIYLSRSFGEGLLARMTKDEARARTAFEAARAQQEKIVQAQPDYGPALCVLGLIDAALGRKDLALEEGRRAIALTPMEKDVCNGSRVLQYFAITAAWAGEKELALQQLEAGLRAPSAAVKVLSYGALKLLPFWDPLRGDPRFEKIVASLAPK